MGFFKNLVKGVSNVVKKVGAVTTKVVSKATGFASQIIPGPLGKAAAGVSKISGFASNLLGGSSKNKGINPKQEVAVQAAAQSALLGSPAIPYTASNPAQGITLGGYTLDKDTWLKRNMGTVIGVGVGVVAIIITIFLSIKKRR
jgi:hypothetical protein